MLRKKEQILESELKKSEEEKKESENPESSPSLDKVNQNIVGNRIPKSILI